MASAQRAHVLALALEARDFAHIGLPRHQHKALGHNLAAYEALAPDKAAHSPVLRRNFALQEQRRQHHILLAVADKRQDHIPRPPVLPLV